ncbi:MAG TPA: 2Fe-2S iron-sulfur cluster-binding protein [Blastocatellia bacterium]|nr:2Fe-2S iron-sulfur cluster-binding protein [Blastocatellia bacterium]HMV81504.1 2Fe-2S iron-sulfur cluster-binding protein [Blastocatellia bacterium]HMX25326.1 2Fe-2S iron-sulfur cluster-binding protein [Blastocatellia bacterium]HMY70918.1 2Fe-2S iron-sulfur cluster-binding protein [Blastocatellia bacterium]HNG28565.1 2Fe-2S iron-sulfur cluster-binding protein [Blastocatellia bacterium]
MPDAVSLKVNGRALTVPEGCTVAAAVALAGVTAFRRSVTGQMRAPLCGMGICFECRVTVNGQPHARSCQIVCREGMDVRTDE